MEITTQESLAIFDAISKTQRDANLLARECDDLRRVNSQLVEALQAVRLNIDVSTINNSKKSTAKWTSIIAQINAALNANKEVCSK